jgi:hypothetical protein
MTPLIFFLVLAAIIGVAVGILIGIFIANRRIIQAPEPVQADEHAYPEPQYAVEPVTQEPDVNKEGFQSIAHLWRDTESSELAVDFDGRFHVKPQTITQKEREQLCSFNDEWREWLCKPGDIALPSSTATGPIPAEIHVEGELPPMQVKSEEDLMPFDTEIEMLPEEKPVILSRPLPASTTAKPSKEIKPETLSIVAQIDEILQEMLKRSPLDQRGIRLTEDPDRGVVVWVGLERYSGIDEVPMKDVQGILRAAVAEWERRSELTGKVP